MLGKETFSMMQEGNSDGFDAKEHYSEEEIRAIESARISVAGANPAAFSEVRAAATELLRSLGVSAELPGPSFDAARPEGMFHYEERMNPERIMRTIGELSGRFRKLSSEDLQSYRDMERYGRQLLEYSVELEEAWKASRIRIARRDIVSRVPGLLREAGGMETGAEEVIRSLEMGPESECRNLVRQYYFEIPEILRGLGSRETEAKTEAGWIEGDGTLSAEAVGIRRENARGELETFPSLRERYENLRSAIEADLRNTGVRTDLSEEEARRFIRAVETIVHDAPARRAVAKEIERDAIGFLERTGAEVPGRDNGTGEGSRTPETGITGLGPTGG